MEATTPPEPEATVVPETVVPAAVVPETVVPAAVVPETVVPAAVVPETVVPVPVVPVALVPEAPPGGSALASVLPSLPVTLGELIGRATDTRAPPVLDDPPALHSGSAVTLSSLETMARHVASPSAREDLWRPIARALGVFILAIFSLRLVFDEMLPRIVLACVVGACVLLTLAMALHAVALARRQRVLLLCLAQLTRSARTDPQMAAALAPRIDMVLSALSADPRVLPFGLSPRPDR